MLKKRQLFPALKLMLKKFQNFVESAPSLAIDARILEFLEFSEHYSVS